MPTFAKVSGAKITGRSRPSKRMLAAAAGLLFTSAALAPVALGQAAKDKIPALASANYGWQSNVADWQDPPPGHGHGPIRPDPEHPFTSNAEAGRTGRQPTNRIGDTKDPILKPWAAAQMQATNVEALKGYRQVPFAAQARCYPGGVPGQLLFPFEPFYFVQTANEVWMMWQRDHMVRRVLLNREHSKNPTPSWFGESVGHYENGDTLVVDTIGLSTKNSYIDNFRTPHTEKLHVVERFTISADGKNLTAIATVEDPDTFNGPLTMQQRWFRVDEPMGETVCSENNEDFFNQNLFPMPEAKTSDF
jgi:hypothetical protein